MKLLISLSFILVAQCRGGVLLHNIRDSLHSKIYGHGLHGENNNSPVININNYQNVNQQSTLGTAGGSTHHNRGDWNSNRGDGYSNHHSMKQESYYQHPSKFGQHHNSNRFGNNKIGSLSSSSAAASSAASQFGGSASTASSSSSSVFGSGFRGSSSTSSSSSSSSSSVNGYRKDPFYNNPWRY
ncbi:uncharacterized protein DDB_G0271670-like isoform X2 [Musca domestica]|uniref:Uncharacterized protein DDB_G0271670-like isoform X2 n=1 Tax=Musca domestica TaxID=7370 RepID=A0A9J7IEU8_MUSDO|nr:uncharacterized protein DDB_G0271670-like isoform X2 [Musca domestica]